jgi:hypothetical protein
MKRKLAILMLVVVFALLSVGPALAQGEIDAPTKFLVEGQITDIDGSSFTVVVWDGHGAAHPYIGQELILQVLPKTIYRDCTSGCVPITFADLQVGDIIDPAKGTVSGGVFTARLVRVDNDL